MKNVNKVLKKVQAKDATSKVEVKDVIKRQIMKTEDGSRVHKMNINMKNKLLKDVEFSKDLEFSNKTKNVLSLKTNKHYSRFLDELKVGEFKSNKIKELNNESAKIRANTKYYIAKIRGQSDKYLVKANKGLIKGYLLITE